MKTMKTAQTQKFLGFTLMLMLMFGIFTLWGNLVVSAATYSGECGDNLTWTLNTDTGVLEISGTGDMLDFSSNSPWYDYQRSIETVILSEGITSIGDYAFFYCESLTSVTIGNSVTSIGDSAFERCRSLTDIIIPDRVTSIGNSAFSWSSLMSVTIGDGVKTIGSYAFSFSALTEITIPNGVTSIGEWAFHGCGNLESATIPDSVTSIGNGAFSECRSLTNVTIGNGVTSISAYTFKICESLTEITIPDSVTTIGQSAFLNCTNLISVTIGNGVRTIGSYAFENCINLTEITIPNSVTSIDFAAFGNCSKLSVAYFQHSDASTITKFSVPFAMLVTQDEVLLTNVKIIYPANAKGFTTPKWNYYAAYPSDYVFVTGVNMDMTDITLPTGKMLTLTASVTPDNATNKNVTWSSNNPSVATVDADGIVTAVSIGTAIITVKTVDGNKTATCTITVKMATEEVQAKTTEENILADFEVDTIIEYRNGKTEFVGTGAVIILPNGNRVTVIVENDLTGNGNPSIEDARVFLESLVGNVELSDVQELAVEHYNNTSALKNLRQFLNNLR